MNAKFLCQLIFLGFAVLATTLEAMYFPSLSRIERMLVTREIQRKGRHIVRQQIDEAGDPEPLIYNGCNAFGVPVVLYIETVIKKMDKTRDPLAHAVFEEIEAIESQWGYVPKHVTLVSGRLLVPNNYLGPNTCYYWVNGGVQVEAYLTNKPELKKMVDSCRLSTE